MTVEQIPGPELDVLVASKLFGMTKSMYLKPEPYSTTWEGMRLVVEEMQRRGYEFKLGSYETISGKWRFWARFEDELKVHDTDTAEIAPHAVALAAIKAIGGEQDDNSN